MSTNDITGDQVKTGATTKEYEKGYDLIFAKKTKPTVEYISAIHIGVGNNAYIVAKNHPASKYQCADGDTLCTSKVISHDEVTGSFETLNTKYVKARSNA